MQAIQSFQIDHTILEKGIYLSREDGAIQTYDIRTCRPQRDKVMENAALHTIEHLFATYVRNQPEKKQIIYFGPMGCRTGFYFLTHSIPQKRVIVLIQEAFQFIVTYQGAIPGASAVECGNFLEHDLEGAKQIASDMQSVLQNWNPAQMNYQKRKKL